MVDSADQVRLYDLGVDPGEQQDVHQDHPDVVGLLRWRLRSWARECKDAAVVPIEDRLDWWMRNMTGR